MTRPTAPGAAGDVPSRRRRRAPVGASPGTLSSDPAARPTLLHAVGYGPDGVGTWRAVTLAELPELRRRHAVVWLDVTGFADLELLRRIGELFGLHRLALEDAVNLQQRAKFEDYGEHGFLVLRMVDHEAPTATEQLALFVGPGFVVTCQERPGDCFEPIRRRLADPQGRLRTRGSDYLAYALLDLVVDAFFPVVEAIDDRLERVEVAVLEARHGEPVVPELHSLRRHLLALRRALWPLREATSALARGEAPHFGADLQPFLRDVHDHVVQLLDLLENYREMSASLMELHLSTVNHRLNEVMKFLTIFSTIFMPLTFVVGVYGMNFEHMPELHAWWGYPACLLVMAGIAAGMLFWFRRRGWL